VEIQRTEKMAFKMNNNLSVPSDYGVAIGTEAFVEKVFEKNRKWFGKNRETGARRIRHAADDVNIMTLRDLKMSPIGYPGQI